ncbi:MAG TPA: hypothetical protein VIM75_10610 [Ohtaekwangia sp.]|uniref:hypothetical protein n=1 Tax=Ohtaekwangia sp. TaxID=2066019 RepID=UPI002F944F76
MIIKKVGFGNSSEAFIEGRFSNSTNIIFSNDNNRGKTLLMQSMMYAIGYESIFPSGFNPKIYYFYSNIDFNGNEVEFLRSGNSILVLKEQKLFVFSTISEFRYYFDKEIYKLPRIDKDGEQRAVDLSLLYELFFLGQDKRNTSNLIVKGLNNKVDFLNMVYSMMGVSMVSENKYDLENLKQQKLHIESQIKSETRKMSLLKKNPEIATFISAASNNVDFKNTSNRLRELHQNIADLKKQRNREENRKIKLESLIVELNSLNRSLSEGRVKCADCGSDKIIFSNDDFEFEVGNNHVRENIMQSIAENISLKVEIINEFNIEIQKEQAQIASLLETSTPDAKNYILFEEEIFGSQGNDRRVLELQNELASIETKLRNNEVKIVSDKASRSEIHSQILAEMTRYYKKVDPEGLLKFDDIFTKSGETYSGSEGQEYYFCKILALNDVLKHDFPILVDSFREGELSSQKEELMIEEFKSLGKQVVLTSTLKREEYNSDKYFNIPDLNVVDYSDLQDSKILQESYVAEFTALVDKFKIKRN